MSGVEIRVRANTTQARKDLGQLERSVTNLDKTASRAVGAFRNLAIGITSAFAATQVVKGISRATDSVKNFENRIRLVTGEVGNVTGTLEKLYDISARSRTEIGGAVEVFNRFGLAIKDVDPGQLLEVTETIQKATVISGASAESARAALVQLGQGLASGELRGQELNSVREQIPRVAQAIADGIGVELGALKKLGEEGALTTQVILDALLSQGIAVDEQFKLIATTIDQATTVFKNEFVAAISAVDQEVGFSQVIITGINLVTDAVYNFRRTFANNLRLIGDEIFIFRSDAYLAFLAVKNAFKDTFSIDTSGFTKAYKELQEIIERVLYTTVDTPGGTEKVKRPIRGVAEAILKELSSIEFSLPELNYENFRASLINAKNSTLEVIRDIKSAITDIFYETKVVGPGVEELLPRDNFFGNSLANLQAVSATIKNIVRDIGTEFQKLKEGSPAIQAILEFTGWVSSAFWKLYDYLVGNSVVPDTVDEINQVWGKLSLENISSYISAARQRFKELFNFIVYTTTEENTRLDGMGGNKKVKRRLFQFLEDAYNDVLPVIDRIKQAFADLFDFIVYTTVETPGGTEKVKRNLFGFIDGNILPQLKSFKDTATGYIKDLEAAVKGSFLYNEDGTFKAGSTILQDTVTVTQKVVVDISAKTSEQLDKLSNITLGFSADDLLSKFNAALVVGGIAALKLGTKGLLLTLAGLTIGANFAPTEGFQSAVRRIARDTVTEINNFLSGSDGNLFATVTLTVGSLGAGVREGLGFTDNDILDAIFGVGALAGIGAIFSKNVRNALIAAAIFDPGSEESKKLISQTKGKAFMLTKNIFRAAGTVGGVIALDWVVDKLNLPQEGLTGVAIDIGTVIGAGFLTEKAANAIWGGFKDLWTAAKFNEQFGTGNRFKILGRMILDRIAIGFTGPVGIAAIAAALGYALVKGYTVAANNFSADSQDLRLALGFSPTVGGDQAKGVSAAFATDIGAALTENRAGLIKAIEDGLNINEIIDSELGEKLFNDIGARIDKRLRNVNPIKIDFQSLFPGFTTKDGQNINDVLKATLSSFLDEETNKIDQEAFKEYGGFAQAFKDAGIVFRIDPSLEIAEEALQKGEEDIKTQIIDALGAEEKIQMFKEAFESIRELPIVTPEQQKSVDNLKTSMDGLVESLSEYVAKLKELPNKDISFIIPGRGEKGATAFASGGKVSGPGSGTSDSILARISNGEYVVRQSSVAKYGTKFMDAINSGTFPAFSMGGLIGKLLPRFEKGGSAYTGSEIQEILSAGILQGPTLRNFNTALRRIRRLGEQIEQVKDQLKINPKDIMLKAQLAEAEERLLIAFQDHDAALTTAIDNLENGEVSDELKKKAGGQGGDALESETIGMQYAKDFASTFQQGLNEALITGDFKQFGNLLVDQLTTSVIDSFTQGLSTSLFDGLIGSLEKGEGPLSEFFSGIFGVGEKLGKDTTDAIKTGTEQGAAEGTPSIFDSIGNALKGLWGGIKDLFQSFTGMFSGGGGFSLGGLTSSIGSFFTGFGELPIFDGLFGGPGLGLSFNQGGIVPNTPYSQVGKDSVPAMLTPGELVVPADKVKGFGEANKGSQQTFNINVSGDVSRQTRKEIVKMLPEITSGVNMVNKENNFRR